MKKLIFILAAVVIIGGGAFAIASRGGDTQGNTTTIDFVMAHKPDNADNIALIQAFADTVQSRTNGAVTVNLLTPVARENQPDDGSDAIERALRDVTDGTVGMSQISVKRFSTVFPAMKTVDVLDAPRIFRDHAHAAQVLDGEVGAELLATINTGSDGALQALGFTYSGGYRNLLATQPITALADLSGLGTRNLSYLSGAILSRLGITEDKALMYRSDEWATALQNDTIQIEEAENIRAAKYARKHPEVIDAINTVVETEHNLFLTALVVHADTLEGLTPEHRAIFEEEAYKLAVQERALSIQQGIDTKTEFEARGITFYTPTAAEKAQLDALAAQVHAEYADQFGDLIPRIQAVQ